MLDDSDRLKQSQLDIDEAIAVLEANGYQLLEQMGKGGFGSCYRVKSMKYNQTFVCKISNDEQSYRRELNVLKKADYVHIVRCYDFFDNSKYYFLILEDCVNGTVYQKLKREGRLPMSTFVLYARQLVMALAVLHSNNIAHLDIKPSNIFLDAYNRVKLGDFGLSDQFDPKTPCKQFRGTRDFIAPEIVLKYPFIPFKADIYSLGVTFYMLLTGRHLFSSYKSFKYYLKTGDVDLSSSRLPENIVEFIERCVAFDANKRPSINEIIQFLDSINNGLKKVGSHCIIRAPMSLSDHHTHSYTPPKIMKPLVPIKSFRLLSSIDQLVI